MELKARHHILILLAATAVMIYLYGSVPYTVEPFRDMDLAGYRQMARASPHLAEGIPPPFAFRLLGPWIAGLLSPADPVGFFVLTVIVSLLIPVLLYIFLLELGIERYGAFIAALVYNVIPGSVVAYLIWLYVLSKLSAGTAGLSALAVPVLGLCAAWLQLGERPGALEGVGMGLILGALAVLTIRGLRANRRSRSGPQAT